VHVLCEKSNAEQCAGAQSLLNVHGLAQNSLLLLSVTQQNPLPHELNTPLQQSYGAASFGLQMNGPSGLPPASVAGAQQPLGHSFPCVHSCWQLPLTHTVPATQQVLPQICAVGQHIPFKQPSIAAQQVPPQSAVGQLEHVPPWHDWLAGQHVAPHACALSQHA